MSVSPRGRVLTIAGATIAALAPAIYAFGPVLVDRWLDDDKPAQEEKQRTDALLQSLQSTLDQLAKSQPPQQAPAPDAPKPDVETAPAQAGAEVPAVVPPPVQPGVPVPPPAVVADVPLPQASGSGPNDVLQAALPQAENPAAALRHPAPRQPPAATAPPEAAIPDAGEAKPAVFAVFEGEKFDLCGYSGFTAQLASSNVQLASDSRDIPGSTFRGFQTSIGLNQPVELWPKCVVAIGAQKGSGAARIVLSVMRDK